MSRHTPVHRHRPGPDINDPPAGIDWTYKREGGQLLLVHDPGRLIGSIETSPSAAAPPEAAGPLTCSSRRGASIDGPMNPQLQATLAKLPTKPGVYLLKDARGRVLYVGKAQSLRSRVRQYWQQSRGSTQQPLRIEQAMDRVSDVEYTLTDTVSEALLLEGDAHQAPSAALQRPPQGRQELPVHQDHAGRRLPAHRANAQAAQRRLALLRAVRVGVERRRGDEPHPPAVSRSGRARSTSRTASAPLPGRACCTTSSAARARASRRSRRTTIGPTSSR